MDALALVALILSIVVGVWAVMERSWPLLILAAAVICLALSGEVHINVND